MQKKIKVLIVDDSIVFRNSMRQALSSEDYIQITDAVCNGREAIASIDKEMPDIVTLDQEMPKMNGLETLQALQTKYATDTNQVKFPFKIIMVSAYTLKGAEITMQALNMGAMDFITKPERGSREENVASLNRQLKTKINVLASQRTSPAPPPSLVISQPYVNKSMIPAEFDAIVIGVSTGGPRALAELLPELTRRIKLPILIVQHMPDKFTLSLAQQLDKKCSDANVKEASDNDLILPGNCYIAPGDKHMILRRKGARLHIGVTDGPVENGCRPSVDVLFRSAALSYKEKVLALILTGMGSDGAKGASAIKRAGGTVFVQDESTSVVWGMPARAVDTGDVDAIVPLYQMAEFIEERINSKVSEME